MRIQRGRHIYRKKSPKIFFASLRSAIFKTYAPFQNSGIRPWLVLYSANTKTFSISGVTMHAELWQITRTCFNSFSANTPFTPKNNPDRRSKLMESDRGFFKYWIVLSSFWMSNMNQISLGLLCLSWLKREPIWILHYKSVSALRSDMRADMDFTLYKHHVTFIVVFSCTSRLWFVWAVSTTKMYLFL